LDYKRKSAMKKIKRQFPRIALIFPLSLLFQTAVFDFCLASDAGVYAGNFLKIPVGARETALGAAFSAVADNANAVYYNPAGLGLLKSPEISLTYDKYLEGITRQWLAFVLPCKYGAFGAGLNYLSVSPFDSYDDNDNRTGSVSASAAAVFLSYGGTLPGGYGPIRSVSYGASVKHVSERLDSERGSGFALDAGLLLVSKLKNLKFSFGAENLLSSEIKFENEKEKLPLKFKAGASFLLEPGASFPCFLFSAEAGFPEEGDDHFGFGLENILYKTLALRIGHNSFGKVSDGMVFGFGLDLRRHTGKALRVDYSYGAADNFGNIQKLTLAYRFGKKTAAALKPEEKSAEADSSGTPYSSVSSSGSFSQRIKLIEKLGETRDWQSAKTLLELLNDKDPYSAAAAAAALNDFDDPYVTLTLLDAKNVATRLKSMSELESLKDERACRVLSGYLRDKSPEIRAKAAEISGACLKEKAAEALIRALKNERNEKVQSAIIKTLNRIDGTGGK